MKEQLFSSGYYFYQRVKIIFILLLSALWVHPNLIAQNETDILRNHWLMYSDAPNSLYKYVSDQAYVLLEKRNKELEKVNSLPGWKNRQEIIRKTLSEICGSISGEDSSEC